MMTFRFPIERGKIREFARATESNSPAYFGQRPLIPPTFLTTAAKFWDDTGSAAVLAELNFDLSRVLHASEEFEFFTAPPRAGQTLTAAERVDSRWQKQSSRGGLLSFATIVTEYRDEDGELVAEQRTTLAEMPSTAT
jgi:hypothetical protein